MSGLLRKGFGFGFGIPKVTTSVVAPTITTPAVFAFTSVVNAALNTVETSNTITISGLSTGVSVAATLSGAASSQIQKNSDAWAFGPLTVSNGDLLTVRHTSSASNSTVASTTLTVGGISSTFISTTLAAVVGGSTGQFDFSDATQSGLLALLEDA